MNESWELKLGDETLGVLTEGHVDQTLVFCRFESQPAFEPYRPLFTEELWLLNLAQMDLWEREYQKIVSLGLRLEPVEEGRTITDFILHIDGGEAWFRWR